MTRTEIWEVELPEGGRFFIELPVPGSGDVGGGRRAAAVSWSNIEQQIAEVSRSVVRTVRAALPGTPARYGVEFGVKLTAETGTLLGVLAKVSGESTMVVRVEWERAGAENEVDNAAACRANDDLSGPVADH